MQLTGEREHVEYAKLDAKEICEIESANNEKISENHSRSSLENHRQQTQTEND